MNFLSTLPLPFVFLTVWEYPKCLCFFLCFFIVSFVQQPMLTLLYSTCQVLRVDTVLSEIVREDNSTWFILKRDDFCVEILQDIRNAEKLLK